MSAVQTSVITPGPGIYPNTPMGDYHAWQCASNSRLTRLRRSPAHMKAYLETPKPDTEALQLGRALHSAILEPDDFKTRYVTAQQCGAMKKGDGKRCTNAGILFNRREGWLCGVHGRDVAADDELVVLSSADYALCQGARDSFFRHHSARSLIARGGETELSLVWQDASAEVACKGRFDFYCPDLEGGTILDLKSTVDASRRVFERQIFSHGYHRQGALYLEGAVANQLAAQHYVIIAFEKTPPYAVAAYRLIEGAIDAGETQLRALLQLYKRCVETNNWPAYPDEITDIALPSYAWDVIDEETKELQEHLA